MVYCRGARDRRQYTNKENRFAGSIGRDSVIFSKTEENGKKSKEAHYFIYSCKGMMAAQILEAKRSHWGIENKLYWVLNMQFRLLIRSPCAQRHCIYPPDSV